MTSASTPSLAQDCADLWPPEQGQPSAASLRVLSRLLASGEVSPADPVQWRQYAIDSADPAKAQSRTDALEIALRAHFEPRGLTHQMVWDEAPIGALETCLPGALAAPDPFYEPDEDAASEANPPPWVFGLLARWSRQASARLKPNAFQREIDALNRWCSALVQRANLPAAVWKSPAGARAIVALLRLGAHAPVQWLEQTHGGIWASTLPSGMPVLRHATRPEAWALALAAGVDPLREIAATTRRAVPFWTACLPLGSGKLAEKGSFVYAVEQWALQLPEEQRHSPAADAYWLVQVNARIAAIHQKELRRVPAAAWEWLRPLPPAWMRAVPSKKTVSTEQLPRWFYLAMVPLAPGVTESETLLARGKWMRALANRPEWVAKADPALWALAQWLGEQSHAYATYWKKPVDSKRSLAAQVIDRLPRLPPPEALRALNAPYSADLKTFLEKEFAMFRWDMREWTEAALSQALPAPTSTAPRLRL